MTALQYEAKIEEIPNIIDKLRAILKSKFISRREVTRSLLTIEEVVNNFVKHSDGSNINIKIDSTLNKVEIGITAKGDESGSADITQSLMFTDVEDDEEKNAVIRGLVSKLFGENVLIYYANGVNHASIKIQKSPYAGLAYTLLALFLGIGTGLLMQYFVPAEIAKSVSDSIFTPIYNMFMNSVKLIVALLVFSSIASSIADFGDLKAIGRIAVKVLGLYLLTSMLAIGIGYLTYTIFPIGSPSLASSVTDAAAAAVRKTQNVSISLIDTFVDIIPSDIITPFQKSNMLQLIFMAFVLGLSAASLSIKFPELKKLLLALNKAFSIITAVIVSFIPLVIFCSMAKMMISMQISNLMNVFVWVPVIYCGDFIMICVYMLLLLIFAGLNPLKFLAKFYPAMFTAFNLSSSNATLPSSLKCCEDLGISRRIYSFSLPLGATINMDGSCITLLISALFMARIFDVPVTANLFLTLFISIMLLSVGSPGVPGGTLVCIALIIPQIGVPAEAISLVMGLYPLVSMMQTCANVTGDAVVTTIIAKHEKLLDIDKYNAG